MLGGVLAVWGLHHLDYPVLRAMGSWNPWGYYLDILFVLAMGIVTDAVFGTGIVAGIWLGALVVVAYSATGGILAGVYADVFQGTIMAAASVLVVLNVLASGDETAGGGAVGANGRSDLTADLERDIANELRAMIGRVTGMENVAVTVRGRVAWDAEAVWEPGRPWKQPWLDDLTGRLAPAGVRYAYIRKLLDGGSITVFLARSGS